MPLLNPSSEITKPAADNSLINKSINPISPPVCNYIRIESICEVGHNSWLLCNCTNAKLMRLHDLGISTFAESSKGSKVLRELA